MRHTRAEDVTRRILCDRGESGVEGEVAAVSIEDAP
jgi:hypothetical protein